MNRATVDFFDKSILGPFGRGYEENQMRLIVKKKKKPTDKKNV
jgi:hypothetical protein